MTEIKPDSAPLTIGVLALQGAYDVHARVLTSLGAIPRLVRRPAELSGLDGLILPGGESTTILKFLERENFFEILGDFVRTTPTFGTCAGCILLATDVLHPTQKSFAALDITVARNAYGTQNDSVILHEATTLPGGPIEMVFIRAPRIDRVGPGIEILALRDGHPTLIRHGHLLAATFHPELGHDPRVHQLFLDLVRNTRPHGSRLPMLPVLVLALLLAPQAPLATLTETLRAAESAHDTSSTTAALLQLTDALPLAPLAGLPPVLAPIVAAASDSDPGVRSLAMLALTALTSRTLPDGSPSGDALPLLDPYIPAIAAHLEDPAPAVRQVTAVVLGGLRSTPAVINPLLAYLTRPGTPTTVDLGVLLALLTLAVDSPAHPEVAQAILAFLHRPDLPASLLPSLFGAIANHPTHSLALDTGLLPFLDPSHPPSTRAALIPVLPRLRLTQQDVEATRARLARLVQQSPRDSPVRVRAAAILPCWHAPLTKDPCPALAVRYRMVPPPRQPTTPLSPPGRQPI